MTTKELRKCLIKVHTELVNSLSDESFTKTVDDMVKDSSTLISEKSNKEKMLVVLEESVNKMTRAELINMRNLLWEKRFKV